MNARLGWKRPHAFEDSFHSDLRSEGCSARQSLFGRRSRDEWGCRMKCFLGCGARADSGTIGWKSCGRIISGGGLIEVQAIGGVQFRPSPNPAAQGDFTAIGTFVCIPPAPPIATAKLCEGGEKRDGLPQNLSRRQRSRCHRGGKVCGVVAVFPRASKTGPSAELGGRLFAGHSSESTNAALPGGSSTIGVVFGYACAGEYGATVTSAPDGIALPQKQPCMRAVRGGCDTIGTRAVRGSGKE